MFDTNVEGSSFNFNVNAVSGTLRKSTQKSKFTLRPLNGSAYIFDAKCPHLDSGNHEEIVVLQTMLVGDKNNVLIEYMTRKDYDEMLEGSLPRVDVSDVILDVKDDVISELKQAEHWGKLSENYDSSYHKDRMEMAEELVKIITTAVCRNLEEKRIGTFKY